MEKTELEKKILKAAEELFLDRGFAGTSTTDIARAVGCNQALVHYYYRTKERLFGEIFLEKVEQFLQFADAYEYDGDFFGFLEQMVGVYFDFLNEHRRLPFFILNELVLNHERRQMMREQFVEDERRRRVYFGFDELVQSEVRKGTIRAIETFDLFLDVVSLVGMTIMSIPMVTDFLEKSDEQVECYVQHRRAEIMTFLRAGLAKS